MNELLMFLSTKTAAPSLLNGVRISWYCVAPGGFCHASVTPTVLSFDLSGGLTSVGGTPVVVVVGVTVGVAVGTLVPGVVVGVTVPGVGVEVPVADGVGLGVAVGVSVTVGVGVTVTLMNATVGVCSSVRASVVSVIVKVE